MKKEHISFAIAGVIFGFLLGFVIAHEIYGGRFAGLPLASASAPSAPSPRQAGPMGSQGAPPAGSTGEAPAGGGEDTMEQVRREILALKQAIQEDPRNATALRRLGSLYMEAGMYDQALPFLRDALAADPADVHARTDMAACLLMTGKTAEALEELKACVARDTDHPKTWYYLGLAHVESGEYAEGETAFARALELSPGSFDMEQIRAGIQRMRARRESGAPPGAPPS